MARHNECAQRAAARLLSSRSGKDAAALYERLRASHPPDTPLRLLGTTPRLLARMLTESGLPSRALRCGGWSDLRAGALACVDLRPLEGGLPRLHWVAVEEVGPEHVRADGRRYAREAWMRAWSCRCSPFAMHRRALVLRD
ncbi:MAG TPA: hypothetical protein VFH78_12995 [Candidatus Thermoplasmatota archaeon]|nr:hypothetical protein [Candidatus Thermoplasmatota archaeon]